MNLEKAAEMFARGAHIGQKHGERSYVSHLRDTVRVLKRIDYFSVPMICAAWLHDTIEDTPTSYQDIRQLFGDHVAELVWAVTDDLGRNRKERKERTWPKIFADREATILKLADLTANVENAFENDSKLCQMYRKEWPEIYEAFEEALKKHKQNQGLELLYSLDKIVRPPEAT